MTAIAHRSAELDDVARRQCGVLKAAQVLTAMTRAEIRANLLAGRWQRPHRGLVVTHNGPLTGEQERWVCLLAAPPGSALAGPTAAQLGGLRGFESEATWIVQPKGRRPLQRSGVVVTWSTRLGPTEIHPLRAPSRTRIERSLLDMCTYAPSESAARAPLLAGVQQGLTTSARLREAQRRRGKRQRNELIRETVDDAEGGIHSVPEQQFDRISVRHHLPLPTRQRVVRGLDGRYYLDADWRDFDLSVEVHGMPHLQVRQWDYDLDRHNELSIDGRRLLQFASYTIRHHPQRVANQLERALIRGGWRPP